MLIVLEGLDGAGKSTQVKRVRAYLESLGRKVEYVHFPQFDSPVFGSLIAEFLRGEFGSIDMVHPKLVALLFAEDRRVASHQIKQWLEDGKTVLLDRYVYSNIAFQCAKLEDEAEADRLADWILETEFRSFAIPRPDVSLFLDVPFDFVKKSLESNRTGDDREYLDGKSDIHESDIEFQSRVRKMYLECTRKDPDFIRVDCADENGNMEKPEVIFDRIREYLDDQLKK